MNTENKMRFQIRTIHRIRDVVKSCEFLRPEGKYGYIEEAFRQAGFIVEDHKLAYDVDTIAKYIIEKIEEINK